MTDNDICGACLQAAILLELFTILAPSASYQRFINELHFILEPTRLNVFLHFDSVHNLVSLDKAKHHIKKSFACQFTVDCWIFCAEDKILDRSKESILVVKVFILMTENSVEEGER